MWNDIKEFTGENQDVKKFVFQKEDACVEAVLYKYGSYEKRTVLCISTQCGCPVGCTFCGTGKKFIKNLSTDEIVSQVTYVVEQIELELNISSINTRCEKFQIMFMSMGEPMLNMSNVVQATRQLNTKYPNAELLLSTIGIRDKNAWEQLFSLSEEITKVGLQFSVHATSDLKRDQLIPFKNKLNLRELRDAGTAWNQKTNRPVYLNFCVDPTKEFDHERIKDLFSPASFNITFSVICESTSGQCRADKNSTLRDMQALQATFILDDYNVRLFDPAGQDDIGAGCGQLWYVQDWMKARK